MVKLTYILVAVVAAAAVVGWYLINPVEEKFYRSEEVSLQASDGVKISATWYTPKNVTAPFKTIILIHEFNGDRHQWDPFVPDFVKRGYAVLSYDMRGFGKSQDVPKTDEYYDTLIKDVEGAVSWLKNRPDVIPDRIGVVGAQLGGTVAYGSSAYVKDVKVSVAISPSDDVGSLILGKGQTDFKPHSILFQFLDTERTSIQPLIDKAGEPKEVRLYRPESPAVRASGIALLHRDLRAFGDLLRFLDNNL